jgi:hypothetical protein
MAYQEEIEAIEKIDGPSSKSKVGGIDPAEELERVAPNKEQFDALLAQQTPQQAPVPVPELSKQGVHLIHQIEGVNGQLSSWVGKTPEEMRQKAQDLLAQVGDIKEKLQTPGLQVDSGMQTLMQNKLSHVDDKLRLVVEKMGAEYAPLETADMATGKTLRTPIERFLGMITKSETQLSSIYEHVSIMGANRDTINPADILALQVKMGFVQQEMEFFTSVLNKALESTKTLMNVQV